MAYLSSLLKAIVETMFEILQILHNVWHWFGLCFIIPTGNKCAAKVVSYCMSTRPHTNKSIYTYCTYTGACKHTHMYTHMHTIHINHYIKNVHTATVHMYVLNTIHTDNMYVFHHQCIHVYGVVTKSTLSSCLLIKFQIFCN